MAATYYTAKVRGSRLIELPESADVLGLKFGDEVGIRLENVHKGNVPVTQADTSVSPDAEEVVYSQELREEYRELVVKKIRNELTHDECVQLEAIRHQLNELDRQSASWSSMEQHTSRVEQEIRDIRLELETYPDA